MKTPPTQKPKTFTRVKSLPENIDDIIDEWRIIFQRNGGQTPWPMEKMIMILVVAEIRALNQRLQSLKDQEFLAGSGLEPKD